MTVEQAQRIFAHFEKYQRILKNREWIEIFDNQSNLGHVTHVMDLSMESFKSLALSMNSKLLEEAEEELRLL